MGENGIQYHYLFLGDPPKQNRTKDFIPRARRNNCAAKIGTAPVHFIPDLETQKPLNETILKTYGCISLNVGPGEVIIAAKPFVIAPATSCRGERCEKCFQKAIKLFKCPNCNYALYCGAICISNDTAAHVESGECNLIKKRGSPSNDNVRFMLRFLLQLRFQLGQDIPSISDLVPGRPTLRTFRDLLDHFDDIVTRSPSRLAHAENCYEEIVDFLGIEGAPPPNYFLQVYGRMVINSFNVIDSTDQVAVASALYIGPSIIDHSCTPNATVSFDLDNDGSIVVRAIEDLSARPTDQFFISYLDLMDPTKKRREHLRKHYYFTCECPRCTNFDSFECDMFTLECQACHLSVIQMDSGEDKRCTRCKTLVSQVEQEHYDLLMELLEQQLYEKNMSFETAQFCRTLMDRDHFSKCHIYYAKVMDVVFDQLFCDVTSGHLGEDKNVLNEAELSGKIVTRAREKYQKRTLAHGLILLKLSVVQQKLGKLGEAKVNLNTATEILKICVGENKTNIMLHDLKL